MRRLFLTAFASEISGISRLVNEERKAAGKKRMGITIPLSMPNTESDPSVDAPCFLSPAGIMVFSRVIRPFRR